LYHFILTFQAYEHGKNTKRIHHLSNISTALRVLESKRVKLVNINASDIVDGRPSIVLGLCWSVILYFQVRWRINNVVVLKVRVAQSVKI